MGFVRRRSCNNHHFRIAPYEKQLHWGIDIGVHPASAGSEFNLLPDVPKFELSHHLAHAWSVLAQENSHQHMQNV